MEEFVTFILNAIGLVLTILAICILIGKTFGIMTMPYTPEAGTILLGSAFWITALVIYLRDKTKKNR